MVRTFLGFRECSVADAEKLTAWPADEVCSRERRTAREGGHGRVGGPGRWLSR
jgi:hypothetical protein